MTDVGGAPCQIFAVPEVEVYKLLPSLTEIAFSRTSDTDDTLTPDHVDIACGYTLTHSKGVETFPGTNYSNTATANSNGQPNQNGLVHSGAVYTAPYNIYYRSFVGNTIQGSGQGWIWLRNAYVDDNNVRTWAKIRVSAGTDKTSLEFILCNNKNTGLAGISDSNIIDRITIPITKQHAKGNGIVQQQYYYLRTASKTVPSAPSDGTSFTTTYDGSTVTWVTTMPVPTKLYPYVWRCIRTQYSVSGWKWESVELYDSYQPALRLLTEKEWPTGNNTKNVYSGKPGEPYKDMFLSTAGGGVFYECRTSGVARGTVSNPTITIAQMTPDKMTGTYTNIVEDTLNNPSNPSSWELGTFWPSFATSLLVALRAYIDELYVNRLYTASQDGLGVRIEEGMIRIYDEMSDQWACFGIDVNGNQRALKLQFWNGSTKLIDYGPSQVFNQIDAKDSYWALLQFASWGNSAPAVNNVFTLVTSSATSYYSFAEGWKKVSGNYQYLVSGTSSPSSYDKKVFKSKSVSNTNFIPDGYYRKKTAYGQEFLQEASDYMDSPGLNNTPSGDTSVAICVMFVYRYVSGALHTTYEVKFQKLSNGTHGKVISVKTVN